MSLTETPGPDDASGWAMAALLAEFEKEILRERTRAGLAHARRMVKG